MGQKTPRLLAGGVRRTCARLYSHFILTGKGTGYCVTIMYKLLSMPNVQHQDDYSLVLNVADNAIVPQLITPEAGKVRP